MRVSTNDTDGTAEPESEAMPWRKYIDAESRRNVPVLREKGYSVWSVIRSYVSCEENKEKTLADYGGDLTIEELEAVLSYYRANSEGIDRKLTEIFT